MDSIAYKLPLGAKKNLLVLMEVEPGEGQMENFANVPAVDKIARDFQQFFLPVSAMADAMVESLKESGPSEVAIEFGVEVSGHASIPLITKTEGKGNFKIKLKWTKAEK